jgi:hypothetical protein
MSVIADYNEEEQALLRSALEAAAVAISAASLGRPEETVSEGFAAAEFVLASEPDYVGNTLVTSVLVRLRTDLEQDHIFPEYLQVASSPGAGQEALLVLGRAARLLDGRTTRDEAAGYKRWLLDIALVAAGAGREDQGFLGMGGVMVNEKERAAIVGVAAALGIEAPAL